MRDPEYNQGMINTPAPTTAKTRRSPDGAYASTGAVRQHGGSLPIYVCNTCGREVVWATSTRTGRKYLANVAHGYLDQRYYVAASVHGTTCETEMRRRAEALAEADWKLESEHHYAFHFMLMDEHDEQGHETFVPQCRRCERAAALA